MSVPPRVTTSTAAILSLVFGIVSWFGLPFIGAIIAIVCGHMARKDIRAAPPGTLDGDGLAVCGLLLGYSHIIIFPILAFLFLAFFGGFAWLAAHMHWMT